MKKIFVFLLTLSLLLAACGAPAADESNVLEESSLADGVIYDEISVYYGDATSQYSSSESAPEPSVPAIRKILFEDIPAAGIYDAETMMPIYEQNVHARRSPASLTKLLTAFLAVRFGDLEDVYTVGTELDFVAKDASRADLREGYRLTLRELLYGLMLCSGNDAAYTIAVNIARDVCVEPLDDREAVAYFSAMMNELLAEIELFDSWFLSPDGYDAAGQYTTVHDLAYITQYVLADETLAEIVKTPSITLTIVSGQRFTWRNSNSFLRSGTAYYDERVTGAKTGSTSTAGKCLVTTALIDGKEYIAVVLGCKTEAQRYGYTKQLIDYVDNCK